MPQSTPTLAPNPKIGKTSLPINPKVVLFGGSYVEFYKVIPKRNYFGALGKPHETLPSQSWMTTSAAAFSLNDVEVVIV